MALEQIILTISISLLTTAMAAQLALSQYFVRRESELVKERYLMGAIDQVAGHVSEEGAMHQFNWTRALMILKQFRDSESFDLGSFDTALKDLNTRAINGIALSRLHQLVGTDFFSALCGKISAQTLVAESFIRDELMQLLKEDLRISRDKNQIENFIEVARKKLYEIGAQSIKHAKLLDGLGMLANILEREKFSFKSIDGFKNKPAVKKVLSELREEFKEISIN
jgi:hypothetical protein